MGRPQVTLGLSVEQAESLVTAARLALELAEGRNDTSEDSARRIYEARHALEVAEIRLEGARAAEHARQREAREEHLRRVRAQHADACRRSALDTFHRDARAILARAVEHATGLERELAALVERGESQAVAAHDAAELGVEIGEDAPSAVTSSYLRRLARVALASVDAPNIRAAAAPPLVTGVRQVIEDGHVAALREALQGVSAQLGRPPAAFAIDEAALDAFVPPDWKSAESDAWRAAHRALGLAGEEG